MIVDYTRRNSWPFNKLIMKDDDDDDDDNRKIDYP